MDDTELPGQHSAVGAGGVPPAPQRLRAARQFALSLPGAIEQPHHDMSSFRVAGKIFATVTPDETRLHVFIEEPEISAAVAEDPVAFEPLYWGKAVRGLRVLLAAAPPARVRELLTEAWLRKAPKSLTSQLDEHPGRS